MEGEGVEVRLETGEEDLGHKERRRVKLCETNDVKRKWPLPSSVVWFFFVRTELFPSSFYTNYEYTTLITKVNQNERKTNYLKEIDFFIWDKRQAKKK